VLLAHTQMGDMCTVNTHTHTVVFMTACGHVRGDVRVCMCECMRVRCKVGVIVSQQEKGREDVCMVLQYVSQGLGFRSRV
jgi:hypothetical protein